jgi:hypothetical protein
MAPATFIGGQAARFAGAHTPEEFVEAHVFGQDEQDLRDGLRHVCLWTG